MSIFSASFSNIAVTAAQDLFELATGATSRIAICEIDIEQNTEAGDAADEMLAVELIRGYTTTGSAGAPVTPVNYRPWSRVSPVTVARNNTGLAANGSPETVRASAFNVRSGWLYRPRWDGLVDERPYIAASSRFVVRLPAAPADSVSFYGTIIWQELGLFAG